MLTHTGFRMIDEALGRVVSGIFRWSARNAKVVVVVYLLATVAFAYGLVSVQVRSTDYDLMPDTHPSASANYAALNKIPGFRNAETMWIEVSHTPVCDKTPNGTYCHRDNITSERAIRGADEATRFIQAQVPELKYAITLPYLVKLINYTASGTPNPVCSVTGPAPTGPIPNPLPTGGGNFTDCTPAKAPDPAAFEIPPDSLTFQRDFDILNAAAPDVIAAQTNSEYTGAILIFIYDVNVTRAGPPAIIPLAAKFAHAAEDWRDNGCPKMAQRDGDGKGPAFDCSKTFVLGQSINGHMTELAQQDFQLWGPIVFGVTFIVLVIAFSDVISMFIAFLSFCMGLVWTYGFMGYMHIPLTFFGLLIVPITMGVGKEYAIYVTNQYMEYEASGRPRLEVWSMVGRRAGAALAIATLTSVAGLLAMFLAGFHIMRDLALLCVFAFSSLFLLAITFIPAAQSLRKSKAKRKEFKPSYLMGRIARGISRNRAVVIGATILITAGLAYEGTKLEEYFGISGGFQPGDYIEQSYQYYNTALGGSGTELVVIQGDIAAPETIDYLQHLDESLVNDTKHIPKASNVNSLLLGLRTYYDLRNGLTNPAILKEKQPGADINVNIPRDKAQVQADIRTMYNSTIWSPLVAIFVSPDADYAVTHAFYKIDREDYVGLKADWDALNKDISNDQVKRPDTIQKVDLVGTQDTFYLFVEYGLPWLDYVGYIATFLTLAIAILVLGRPMQLLALVPGAAVGAGFVYGVIPKETLAIAVIGASLVSILILVALKARDTLAVMVPMMLASVWWIGLLPLFGIKASMTLMLPTVMLISVGSDYAIQYVWNRREVGSMEEVYRTTGKANLYVVVATVIAFLLFVPMKLVLSSQGALAAALAIVTIFVSTTLLVPLFYPEPSQSDHVADEASVEVIAK